MDAPVAPVRVLLGQAQNQLSNGPDGAWSARAFRSRHSGVASPVQVSVPAQDRIRAHQQTEPVQDLAGQSMHERGKQRPVSRTEPHPGIAELPLQHSNLVAQREDLDVFVSVAHRDQAKQGEGVGQAEEGQSR